METRQIDKECLALLQREFSRIHKEGKNDAYKECVDLLMDLASTTEYKNGLESEAEILREAAIIINQRRDDVSN